jgi:hypothetical protein
MGVRGESASGSGIGVSGYNGATSGNPIAVKGASSGSGIGVYGFAGRGVFGDTNGPTGIGVVARNSSATGTGTGVSSQVSAPGATGVYTENSSTGGAGVALHAKAGTDTAALIENVSGSAGSLGLRVESDGNGIQVVAPNSSASLTAKAISAECPSGSGLESTGAVGVRGITTGGAPVFRIGVWGSASAASDRAGVFENSAAKSTALQVDGGVTIKRGAGLAMVASGTSSVVVTPDVPLTSSSIVLATAQAGDTSVGVRQVTVGASTFTIHLTGTATIDLFVGWMVVTTT